MSKYDFIISSIKFSFSNVSTFETCPYCWKLTYIDYKDREGGFFSDYGLLVHKTLEEFFNGNINQEDLVEYYVNNYEKFITHPPPPYPKGMSERYFNDGINFFKNFKFEKDNWEIISVEDSIYSTFKEDDIIVKPDLVIKNKKTGKIHLCDYKTHKFKFNEDDNEYREKYKKQLLLYAQYLWVTKKIKVDQIDIWLVRNSDMYSIIPDKESVKKVLGWLQHTIKVIKKEEEFLPNLSKSNSYFCSFLCSVRNVCEYKKAKE